MQRVNGGTSIQTQGSELFVNCGWVYEWVSPLKRGDLHGPSHALTSALIQEARTLPCASGWAQVQSRGNIFGKKLVTGSLRWHLPPGLQEFELIGFTSVTGNHTSYHRPLPPKADFSQVTVLTYSPPDLPTSPGRREEKWGEETRGKCWHHAWPREKEKGPVLRAHSWPHLTSEPL